MISYRKCLVTTWVTANDFPWGFKPGLSYNKQHSFSTYIRDEKENKMYLLTNKLFRL